MRPGALVAPRPATTGSGGHWSWSRSIGFGPVAEITYLSWPHDGLLRHTVFVGLREDKPAREVQRETPRTT
jgi:ATP-dependent DNA ligase